MSRHWFALPPLVALFVVGCSRPEDVESTPALQAGDVLRPELSFAYEGPWPAEAKVAVGMLVRGTRPDGEKYYLRDSHIEVERAVMGGRVTFYRGDQVMGEPHELPFVHDC